MTGAHDRVRPFLLVALVCVASCSRCGPPAWSRNALTPTEAADVFDVVVPPVTLAWQSRKHGSLQVWSFEVLARLRTEDRAWFLSKNALTAGAVLPPDPSLEAQLRRAGAPPGRPRLTRFPLPVKGTLERWLVLIEYDDQLWVWLDSMDSERG